MHDRNGTGVARRVERPTPKVTPPFDREVLSATAKRALMDEAASRAKLLQIIPIAAAALVGA